MQSVLLWHGRYRITESRPEHISATCFIFKAVDEQTIDSDTQQPIKVVSLSILVISYHLNHPQPALTLPYHPHTHTPTNSSLFAGCIEADADEKSIPT